MDDFHSLIVEELKSLNRKVEKVSDKIDTNEDKVEEKIDALEDKMNRELEPIKQDLTRGKFLGVMLITTTPIIIALVRIFL